MAIIFLLFEITYIFHIYTICKLFIDFDSYFNKHSKKYCSPYQEIQAVSLYEAVVECNHNLLCRKFYSKQMNNVTSFYSCWEMSGDYIYDQSIETRTLYTKKGENTKHISLNILVII